MGLVLQTHHIERSGFAPGVRDRDAARGHQAFGLQLFAAQADHHHLAPEVGVQADVAQGADRDLGALGVDGHAAAVAVLDPHHVVHVGKQRQQLVFDARDRKFDHARDTLHRGGDGQDVAGAHRAIGIAKAFECVALQRGQRRGFDGGHGQVVQLTSTGHVQQTFVHPAACGNVLPRMANRDAVAQHRAVGGQVNQRDFVALRHLVAQHQPAGQDGACGQASVVGHDGDVVAGVHADGVGRGHVISYDQIRSAPCLDCAKSWRDDTATIADLQET